MHAQVSFDKLHGFFAASSIARIRENTRRWKAQSSLHRCKLRRHEPFCMTTPSARRSGVSLRD